MFHDLELLDSFFQLDFIVITTQQVIDEITDENQKARLNSYLTNECLKVDTKGTTDSIFNLAVLYSGLSLVV